MLTLAYHVQPNPGEDHVGPSHVHLLWATWTTAKPQQQTRRQSNGIWNGISTEKSKIMTNNMNNTSADISMDGQKLEEVISSKYLSVTLRKDGTCSTEVLIRISQAMAAVARLSRIWLCNIISFASKFKLYKSLVISTFLCGCKILTLLSDFEKKKKKNPDFPNQIPEKTSSISYLEHKTKDWVWNKINFLVGPQESLLAIVKIRKLAWFEHVTYHGWMAHSSQTRSIGKAGGKFLHARWWL